MIYDMIPALKPYWAGKGSTKTFVHWVQELLNGSDLVLTISDFSRKEIEVYCEESGISTPSITVVRLGDELKQSSLQKFSLPRFIPNRSFFVYVSNFCVRKNHRLLYDVWSTLASRRPKECPDLLCIGASHTLNNDLLNEIRHDRHINARIHILHNTSDEELVWYYKNCDATIYPSRYEGWGLPVAESLAFGKFCLVSNATSIPEITKDGPEFFDPLDAHELTRLVERVLDDKNWVQEREENIKSCFKTTQWTQTAQQIALAIHNAKSEHDFCSKERSPDK